MVSAFDRFIAAARAVADAEPARIEAAVVQFSGTRAYLAPLAWMSGTLVLVVRGAKLLVLNWRLTVLELIPAAWVWLAMWDLKRHGLRAPPLQQLTPGQALLGGGIAIAWSIAAFWCNAVFCLAITHQPPQIKTAHREARRYRGWIIASGVAMGVVVGAGLHWISRTDSTLVYWLAVVAMYGGMLVALVVVPARLVWVRKRQTPTQTIARWAAGGALSAVAMTPGFVLDRLGLLLLTLPHLKLVGFVTSAIGAALYAAGLSSVKAIKLSMKLEDSA